MIFHRFLDVKSNEGTTLMAITSWIFDGPLNKHSSFLLSSFEQDKFTAKNFTGEETIVWKTFQCFSVINLVPNYLKGDYYLRSKLTNPDPQYWWWYTEKKHPRFTNRAGRSVRNSTGHHGSSYQKRRWQHGWIFHGCLEKIVCVVPSPHFPFDGFTDGVLVEKHRKLSDHAKTCISFHNSFAGKRIWK